ncbi:MAG TPA: 2-hydroxyacyl-CoA dehydratase family protein [bacterium]|nr:2-hydroxyacyl-CoA dehydratase family protein [bacterium]
MANSDFPSLVEKISRDPKEQFKSLKRQDESVFLYSCSYVPEEFLYAMGIVPFRMLGRSLNIQAADRHFQTYCCSQVRCMMEDFINGDYDEADGVIFAHTCDTMQQFHDIYKKNFPDKFVRNMNFPARIDGDIPFRYAKAEAKRFLKSLEEFTGKPLDAEKLAESVTVYNKNRTLLEKLYNLHLKHPEKIPSKMLLQSVIASMCMDKHDFNRKISDYLETFDANAGEDTKRKRIMLVGSVNISEDVYDLADEYGAMIADDDMCTGHRYFSTQVSEPSVDGVIKRYFNRPHCAAKHRDVHSRERYLLEMIDKKKIDGVIFLYLKFCDPHGFDYPDLKVAMENKNIPNQFVEIEQSSAPSGQIRTKLQAFVEILS